MRPTLAPAGARLDGKPVFGDVAATFLRSEERSLVERVPAVFDRASLFRPGFVHPVLWWVLLAGWLVALPFGLARALSATWAEES